MKKFIVAIFKTLIPAFLLYTVAIAGPKEDALQIIDQWTAAFTASDVDGIVKLYSPNALFLGTGSKTIVLTQEGIRKYFEAALLTNRPRSAKLDASSVIVVSDAVVVVSGLDTITGVRDGNAFSANGRVTFVIAKHSQNWEIVQFHRSSMPN